MLKGVRIISAALALFVGAAVANAQDEAKYKELPNFHRVNVNLYRGGQPAEEGFKQLVALGIKTVVNLRDDDERERVEEAEVHALGLRYFNIPLHGLGRPTDEKIDRVLAIINAPENQPVFVHCRRGSDRTGTVIACYRISQEGWTSERAKAEAKRYGMGFWVVKMKDYIRDYYERHAGKAKISHWIVEQRRLVAV